MASVSNVPGARYSAITWTDTNGNLWLFGGGGYDSTGTNGILNDLWEFKPTTQTWTWVGGSSTANAESVYGMLGVASASNVPGGREGSASWIDGSGNLWLFGGSGIDSTGTEGFLNDLWRYQP
jgi:N-acetylneuraminic acid mutarotase